MIVFFKERLAFLSVPKTGTTAYEKALAPRADMVISDPPMLKHAPVYRYNRFIRPMFLKICDAELELMAVMREPISWLGSLLFELKGMFWMGVFANFLTASVAFIWFRKLLNEEIDALTSNNTGITETVS